MTVQFGRIIRIMPGTADAVSKKLDEFRGHNQYKLLPAYKINPTGSQDSAGTDLFEAVFLDDADAVSFWQNKYPSEWKALTVGDEKIGSKMTADAILANPKANALHLMALQTELSRHLANTTDTAATGVLDGIFNAPSLWQNLTAFVAEQKAAGKTVQTETP